MRLFRRNGTRGSTILEFTLVGIPAIFLLISIFEISRGMWTYHTLAYAVNVGARYASLHGAGCFSNGYTCGIQVQDVVNKVAWAATGIPSTDMGVTLISNSGTLSCNPLSACQANNSQWPPPPGNAPGQEIVVTANYTFRSALAMFFPGSAPIQFAVTNLGAESRQVVQF